MMPIKSIVTLDQLEDSEYLFRIVSTVLPHLCLDYKVCDQLKTTFVHPFDVFLNNSLGSVTKQDELQAAISKLGINYLIDTTSRELKLFNVTLNAGNIDIINTPINISSETNPIINTHSFYDLPPFTQHLLNIRLTDTEYRARFIGGYIKPDGSDSMDVLAEKKYPDLNFDNTYLFNILYKDVINAPIKEFKAKIVNGVLSRQDFDNLIGVRQYITAQDRPRFDNTYNIADAARHYGVNLNTLPLPNVDLTTMPTYKHLIMYEQYFVDDYDRVPIYYNGNRVIFDDEIINFTISMRYQSLIPRLVDFFPDIPVNNNIVLHTRDPQNAAVNVTVALPNVQFVDINRNNKFFINFFNLLAKEQRSTAIKVTKSMFWDGMDYEEYKSKNLQDMMFINSTCYVFGLYNHNNTTYCSILSDIISAEKTPIRVCLLPRVVGGKTVTNLISETLKSISSMTIREFPRKDKSSIMHIGLSETGFMRFFQLLRLMADKPHETAIKEVVMAYVGIKLGDKGSPYYIRKESYQDFIYLLFASMGFKVTTRRSIMGSNNISIISIRPRVTKQYIITTLMKTSCSKNEAEKLITSAFDLLNFMVSVSDFRDYQSYRQYRNYCPRYFYAGSPEGEETIICDSEPISILDRIDTRGIFSAYTINEMMDTDIFSPENKAFKNNLSRFIESGDITGEDIFCAMPYNILDRIITNAGTCTVSIGDMLDNITTQSDCNMTNEITDMINASLKNTISKDNNMLVSQALDSVANRSKQKIGDLRQSSCKMALLFKNLATSIYTIERIFNAKVGDDVKASMLEKYKVFTDISMSLYKDLIAMENLKAMLYIIRRSGCRIDDAQITTDDLVKSYSLIRPKILSMINYYNEMSRGYFEHMKKNLNMTDGDSVSFDDE
ncbi:CPXV142 protein [Cowpox virus]|uniref:Major core protein OPG136 precursor n=1 Tax=Cowpox virus TaxID=10243 RepID=G0XUR7_COWPX|nr:core protein 4a, precursor p4a [Cowpox virus]AGY98109.1 CPXV142 protein [Cowpox virus]ARR30149.1 CPXV142 protein [Cowpox virus]ARR30258.1 CPXV142 protein [Cowpox virus]AZY90046.1 CPXV142 protein [Cowpox virus]